ncbi:hypothetical protein RJ640_027352 [Escallonia rubra]|uniref:Uncharacterized protein n=1 Tax=Escallonia rubra TaxID=112253 RepID=A0AA88U2S8_9ASTE|nr:hypothetical protein RJ640_027352 [Escallonia rubra]
MGLGAVRWPWEGLLAVTRPRLREVHGHLKKTPLSRPILLSMALVAIGLLCHTKQQASCSLHFFLFHYLDWTCRITLKNFLLLVFTLSLIPWLVRWSVIASHLKGRTDNDVKNYWNTKLKKKMQSIENNASMITKNSCHFSSTPSLQPAPTADSIYFGTSGCSTMNYQHNSVAQTMILDPNQFSLARLMEVQERVTTSGYSSFSATSSSQEFLSTLSPPISLENGYASWSGSGGGEEEGFIVGLGSDPSADIVIDGFGFHEKIIGAGGDMTTINYSSLAGNVSDINSSLGFYESVAN